MNEKLERELVRFHVLDILAWKLLPDWNNPAHQMAAQSCRQLQRLLKISGREIEARQAKLGIPISDR